MTPRNIAPWPYEPWPPGWEALLDDPEWEERADVRARESAEERECALLDREDDHAD